MRVLRLVRMMMITVVLEWKSVTVDCDPYDAWSYFSFRGKTVKTLKVKSMEGL
ncbi:MAG: hypothetical protein ACLU4J_06355 [Butyricimonas paravirosa]